MFRLKKYLKDYKLQLTIGPICKLIEAIFELIVPLVMASIIDVGVLQGDRDYVIKGGLIMLLLGALGLGFALVCQKSAAITSQGSGTKLRNALYKHINTLSYHDLDTIGTASLITRMTNDINQLQLAVAMIIRLVIRAPFLVIGALIMAMTIDLRISIIFFISAVIIGFILYLIMSKSIPFFKTMQKGLDKLSLISRENLSGNRVIRAFSKQKYDINRFDNCADDVAKTAVRVGRLSAMLNPLTYVVANLAIVAIVWFGGVFVNVGELLPGQIIALVNYMTQILLAMIVVSNLVVIFTKASASATRINEVFDTKPTVLETSASNITPIKGSAKIEFKDVCFSYGDDKNALQGISLTINKGETIGIIGGTGCGKSTLINLIPRFYDVTKGEILVDGINVQMYPFKQLRRKIGLVPQRAVLFTGTIKENLCYLKANATDEDIEKALEISQAKEFVDNLPLKANTDIVRGGQNLSGGQKQRLTIARAVIAKPEILILDDSASALDFATDKALRYAIKAGIENTTVIIVSQRVASVNDADKIVVLHNGHMVDIGTHNYLYNNCDEYKEICHSQGQTGGQKGSQEVEK
ncbi:MAG TPA: ABC transporter ATP-binding protein [Clostridiales bacterium]|nr:ABC transporter ATP-binding protein [Clostridiales bacterium]